MKAKDHFYEFKNRKIKFSLKARLTVLVTVALLLSFGIAFGIVQLLGWLFPVLHKVPEFIQIGFFSLIFVAIATRLFAKVFFDPVKKLREGMGKVSEGDFTVRLQTKSSSLEMQEMFAGFNMMVQELEATEILQSDFVSNVSHEFKTPINAIEGYATLLQDYSGDPEQKEYVEKILFNTKRLSSLVGNILLLSKIENQTINTNKIMFRLDEQIRQSILALEPEWSAKNIEFDIDLENVDFYGSENLMHHVWDNVIGNAIKFSPKNGKVQIRLYKQDGKIFFSVRDNGSGLSDEAKKHIFDKFYQGDSSHKQEGNGLGLSLVKRILYITGGEIKAENVLDGGCLFTIIF
ncbi:MAG: HAMP domain-containing histidine kinase [Ruminococcaceae bacterium]|nr:HAMP domain-containing histidine kinase [Oscillospiraceae bacterium]